VSPAAPAQPAPPVSVVHASETDNESTTKEQRDDTGTTT
jgi:hypothetical protein